MTSAPIHQPAIAHPNGKGGRHHHGANGQCEQNPDTHSAPPRDGYNGSKPNTARRIPITVHHTSDQRAKQHDNTKTAHKDFAPLPHAEQHVPFGVASATEIARQNLRPSAKIVGKTKFGAVARVLCAPPYTAETIAARIGVGVRTVERWMSGEPFDPPTKLINLVITETFGE